MKNEPRVPPPLLGSENVHGQTRNLRISPDNTLQSQLCKVKQIGVRVPKFEG